MRKFALLVIIFTLISTVSAQDFIFGINFDAGGKFDGSFNEGTWNGFANTIEELIAEGFDVEMLEFEGTPDTSAQGLRAMAEEQPDLLISPGFAQADAVTSISTEYPLTNFVIIDGVAENDNVRSILFKEHEGSYLVGYIAGILTQTGVVGFVGGMDIPLIRKFALGYEEGVKAACSDCSIIQNFTGVTPDAWNDPAKAKELATLQHGQGADIIYAAAGASGKGVIDFVNETMCYGHEALGIERRNSPLNNIAASIEKSEVYLTKCGTEDEPLFFIGVDSNQNPEGDTDGNPATLNHGLTSMVKRVDVAARDAIYDVVNDDFSGGIVILGLADDGVDIAIDEYNRALISEDLLAELQLVRDSITSGAITVTDYSAQ